MPKLDCPRLTLQGGLTSKTYFQEADVACKKDCLQLQGCNAINLQHYSAIRKCEFLRCPDDFAQLTFHSGPCRAKYAEPCGWVGYVYAKPASPEWNDGGSFMLRTDFAADQRVGDRATAKYTSSAFEIAQVGAGQMLKTSLIQSALQHAILRVWSSALDMLCRQVFRVPTSKGGRQRRCVNASSSL